MVLFKLLVDIFGDVNIDFIEIKYAFCNINVHQRFKSRTWGKRIRLGKSVMLRYAY